MPDPSDPPSNRPPAPGLAASLAADVRECPITWGLAASWVVVFAAMLAVQWALGVKPPGTALSDPLGVSGVVGHRFGDLSWAEVRRGEAWRLVTATFIHFGLIHIGMNLAALVKLGQLIEPWYGAGPFLAVCLAIGGLGNLVGGLLRVGITAIRSGLAGSALAQAAPSWFDAGGPAGIEAAYRIQSGGGSTILLGLLGLGAVVGWRSGTRIGSFLRDQMVTALVLTALLGAVLINLLDNYGHAGGAIVGAAVGFVHRPLLRISERSRLFRRVCGVAGLAVIAASIAAAARDDRSEGAFRAHYAAVQARFRLDEAVTIDLDRIAVDYVRVVESGINAGAWGDRLGLDLIALEALLGRLAPLPATPPPLAPAQRRAGTRGELAEALDALADHPTDTWGVEAATALAAVIARARAALDQPPDYAEVYAFTLDWRAARSAVATDRDRLKVEQVALERENR